METTDQNMVENSEDLGPLLMHDPGDEVEGEPSLSSADQHNLLTDVHLPDGSNFIPPDEEKGHQLDGIGHRIDVDKEDHGETTNAGVDGEEVDDPSAVFKFEDGQPVQLEDGSTAYILTSFKKGTQPIILEDGTTAYISHEPPTPHDSLSLDQDSLNILDGLPAVTEAEEKRIIEQAVMTGNVGDNKLFKCDVEGCKKVYTTYHHLNYHRRSHLDKKPFVCGFAGCEKTFATSYGLKSHIRVHTGEKPYKCHFTSECTKAFKTSGDLQKHIRTHTGEKPFRCPFEGCNRSFTTSNIRKVHIRTHTGEKPYSCNDCGKKFASATNHRNHIRIHTGEKPYVCSYADCTKRFTEYSSLYKHQVTHTGQKPYTCGSCGKNYRQASTLAMHRRTAHHDVDVVLADTDLMGGQLIAQDFYAVGQSKEGLVTTEVPVVGIVNQHKNLLPSTQLVTTQSRQLLSPPNSGPGKQTTDQHITHINPRNVVVLTSNTLPRGVDVISEQAINTADTIEAIDEPSVSPGEVSQPD